MLIRCALYIVIDVCIVLFTDVIIYTLLKTNNFIARAKFVV